MVLKSLIDLGTEGHSFSNASRIRGTNIAVLVTILLTVLYCIIYVFILNEPLVASINAIFIPIYGASLVLNKYKFRKVSKILFFSAIMLHLLVCTNILVTNKSGFHLYFILVPTGAFALLEFKEKFERFTLSFIAIVLFFYCENTLNLTPLIELSDEMNHLIYQSVFFFSMLEIMFVLTLFANEIETNELKLTKKATTDSLTGIYNRHHFFEQAVYDLAIANEFKRPFSVMLLDFDNFKKINDKYGHHIGDLSLVETANQIKRHCRSQDCFARIGGDEFVMTLADTTLDEAKVIAERIQKSVEKNLINNPHNIHLHCKVSIGISSKHGDTNQLKEIMQQADKALYQAKAQGGNRVALAS
jgi:diguanylate cyclase (GGDEF)-like protein